MTAEDFQRSPSVYQQLLFIDRIYKTREDLHETLQHYGYRLHQEIDVPKVDCFMYIPKNFPKDREEAAEFDFEPLTGGRLVVGVCIGGTCLSNGWDEKCKLGIQGILKINNNCSSADKAATQIFLALDDFYRNFTELTDKDISLDVFVSGYSLGGLFAQVATVLLQDWANITGNKVSCRTFESPGVPEMYHEISRNYDEDADVFWKQRITNYKSIPNPLNTVFQDIGGVYHLKNVEHISCNTSWVIKCIAGSARRIAFWTNLLQGFGLTSMERTFCKLSKFEQRMLIGATMAMEMGMELNEIVRNHDVALMLSCFDEKTEKTLPGVCLEMMEWPMYAAFEDTAMQLLQNMYQGLMVMNPRNAGIHTLFLFGGKRGFVERKLATIPGYRVKSEA